MAGHIVKTKQGKQGKTKNEDQPVYVESNNNQMQITIGKHKIPVYFDDGTKMLCDPKNLEQLGYWD